MKKSIFFYIIVVFVFCIMLSSNISANEKGIKIGACLHDQAHGFQIDMGNGIKNESAKYENVELVFTDSELDLSKELSIIETFINAKVDAIILGPIDTEASVAAVTAANEAKIPVVIIDCPVSGGKVVSFVGYDSYAQGFISGELMVKYLGGKGKVAEVDFPFKSTVIDNRNKGFRDAIQGTDIEIVAVQSGNAKREDSMAAAEYMIQANPDLSGIFGVHGDAGVGALAAVEASGKQEQIVVTTIDADKDVLEAIKRNSALKGISTTYPEEVGKWGFILALESAKGNIVPSFVEIPAGPVEKDNVDDFWRW